MFDFRKKKVTGAPKPEAESRILVLGSGCKSCRALYDSVLQVLQDMGNSASVSYVTDLAAIASYGVMRTPALVIDGQLVSAGQKLSPARIRSLLEQAGL